MFNNMGVLLQALLDCSILLLFLNSYPLTEASWLNPWVTAEKSSSGARNARSTDRPASPASVNCRLKNWSRWSPCTACTETKHRFRSVEKPSQYGGTQCQGILWDKLACPAATTQCMEDNYCEDSFRCAVSGRCLSQLLVCNGESDCQYDNDEANCTHYNYRSDLCATILPIPGAVHGTQGFNALTEEFVDKVLDPNYFGETCEYVYNGEWRDWTYDAVCEHLSYNDAEKNYRKPYNYHTYQFMAEASTEGTHEYFEDMVQLLKARKEGNSFNLGVTVGIEMFEGGLHGSEEKDFFNNVTSYKSKDVGFIRLFSKVQTAWFKMRSDKLMLHEDMYQSLMELPVSYDFGMYARFLNTYGTHYVTEGSMGGTLEHVIVTDKQKMASNRLNGSTVGRCFGGSFGLNTPLGHSKQVKVGLTLKDQLCWKDVGGGGGGNSSDKVIVDEFTIVKGGTVQRGAALVPYRDPLTYRNWGKTLKFNPTLIDYEVMPIYELVRLSMAGDHVGQRLAHLKRAWDQYLQEFNSCRCGPCRNNGLRVLVRGTACQCICKEGYEGDACERHTRRALPADGAWSCWGQWSSCQSGRRTRTRDCNNPAPDRGGAPCLGTPSQAQGC